MGLGAFPQQEVEKKWRPFFLSLVCTMNFHLPYYPGAGINFTSTRETLILRVFGCTLGMVKFGAKKGRSKRALLVEVT